VVKHPRNPRPGGQLRVQPSLKFAAQHDADDSYATAEDITLPTQAIAETLETLRNLQQAPAYQYLDKTMFFNTKTPSRQILRGSNSLTSTCVND
jgi:hypothetical protein